MDKLEELQKAIEVAAEHGMVLIKKSQMAFDFSAPNPHHVAYTRTNASGTVSNIAAKGAPKPQEPKTRKEQLGDTTHAIIGKRAISATSLHKINGTHEGAWGTYHHPDGRSYEAVKHQGSWHLTGNYTQYAPAEKPAPKPNATTKHEHYHWGRLTKVDGKGISAILHPEHQEAVGKLQDGESTSFKDEQGINWKAKRDGEHVKLTPPSIHSSKTLVVKHSDLAPEDNAYDPQPGDDAPLKNPEARYQQAKHQQLIDGVHKVGNDLLNNPMLAEHHENIKNTLQGLKANPTAKAAAQVAGDLKLIAGKAEKEAAYQRSSSRADELTIKADASNSSQDHETARLVHMQAAGIYPKGSHKAKYHLDMAKYHAARP